MEHNGKSTKPAHTTVLEAAVFGPLERAIAEGTDPLTLLETEDALRSIGCATARHEIIARSND